MSEWLKDTRAQSNEEILLEVVARLDRHRAGRIACEIHLCLLRPYHRRPHHLRIARKALEPLVRKFDAGIYELHNGNMVVITKGAAPAEIDPYVTQVRALFPQRDQRATYIVKEAVDFPLLVPHRRAAEFLSLDLERRDGHGRSPLRTVLDYESKLMISGPP